MGLYDLADRLNWQQAARILGVAKSTFFRMVQQKKINSYGVKGCRFYLKSELMACLERRRQAKCNDNAE